MCSVLTSASQWLIQELTFIHLLTEFPCPLVPSCQPNPQAREAGASSLLVALGLLRVVVG